MRAAAGVMSLGNGFGGGVHCDLGGVGQRSHAAADQSPVARSMISEMLVRLCPSRVPNFEIHTTTFEVSV